MFKRALSLFICIIMLVSSFIGTGVLSSANNELAGEILEQAQAEPTEEPIEEPSAPAPELPTATAGKNDAVVVPDTATATYSGDNLTWQLDTSTGVLTIIGTGKMNDYSYESYNGSRRTTAPWNYCISRIRSVVIGDSVTSIGSYAFYNCTALTSVTIGDSVTSIGENAFDECTSLKSVTIGDSVTSIGGSAFYNCRSLTSVTIGDSVTSIGDEAFCDCTSLTSVTIGDSVTSIGYRAFIGCDSLASVTIPDSVTSIGEDAFSSCDYLKSVTIGDSVTSIGNGAFWYCKSLASVTIPDSVTSIGNGAFYYCTSLKSVTIGDSVTSIGYRAFEHCTSLKSVTIPDSVTSIGSSAFSSCTSLTSVTIPDSVTSMDSYAFNSCTSLKSVTIGDSVTSIGDSAFYSCTSLTRVTIGDSVKSIGKAAFFSCTSLTSVTIPDSVTSIGYYAFNSCTSLTSVTIPDSVTSIDYYAFHNCRNGDKILNVTLNCVEGSYAHTYAVNNGFKYELICKHSFTTYIPDNNATCTEDGTKTAYCDNGCGATDTIVDEGSACHRYTREEILRAPTCMKVGYKLLLCDCGASVRETMDQTDHIYTDYIYNEDASCTSDGTETACCDFGCGTSDTQRSVGTMIEHSFTVYNYNGDASCTSDGTETSACDYGCGNTSTRIVAGSKLEHIYGSEITLEPTCINTGIRTYTCTGCGDSYTESIDVIPHEYTSEITKNPTCTATGISTYTCMGCGDSYTESIERIPHSYVEDILEEATCTAEGFALYVCDCGDFYTADIPKTLHTWGEWITVTKPTYTEEGTEKSECSVCGISEVRSIPCIVPPPKPEITVNNYTVTITNAENIKDMRYALGTYSTTTEIKNAEGNVAISNTLVQKYTVDGSFVYDMPNGGYYTIWIRMQDGTNYIIPLDVTKFTPSVSAYGVTVTLHDLYNVKDFYIAKGEYNTYREIKDNGYIFSATAAKVGNKHDYTHTVYEPGVHTVLVRYNDGRVAVFHEELSVDEPTFTVNGLQVTIGNIPDVKVIRTAYGEYNTPGDTKRAEGARNFSNKSVIKNAEEYTLQYRENGMVTIIVEYNNGYVKVFHHEIAKKQAVCMQSGSTVVLKDLDDFVMIRYAMGEYSTSAEIKRAAGSKVIKPADITNGHAIITGLTAGTYTFCVQFDDESYNYFVVEIQN